MTDDYNGNSVYHRLHNTPTKAFTASQREKYEPARELKERWQNPSKQDSNAFSTDIFLYDSSSMPPPPPSPPKPKVFQSPPRPKVSKKPSPKKSSPSPPVIKTTKKVAPAPTPPKVTPPKKVVTTPAKKVTTPAKKATTPTPPAKKVSTPAKKVTPPPPAKKVTPPPAKKVATPAKTTTTTTPAKKVTTPAKKVTTTPAKTTPTPAKKAESKKVEERESTSAIQDDIKKMSEEVESNLDALTKDLMGDDTPSTPAPATPAPVEKEGPSELEKLYELEGKIQSGDFGILWKGMVKGDEMEKVVAIKEFDKTKQETMANHEIYLLQDLLKDVPNIMKLESTMMERNKIYLISYNTEYYDDVYNRLVDIGMYHEDGARCLFSLLLESVQQMQKHKIVHRMIEPKNLILNNKTNDRVSLVLVNFHHAKSFVGDKLTTICGIPEYSAPEVLTGQGYDEKADNWSVGCILYFMLCRFHAFNTDDDEEKPENAGKSPQELLKDKVIRGDYLPLNDSFFNEHFSDDVTELVTNLLQVDPTKRWTITQALECNWLMGLTSEQCKELYFKAFLKNKGPNESNSTGKPIKLVYDMDEEMDGSGFGTLFKATKKDDATGKYIVKEMTRGEMDHALNEKIILHELRSLSDTVMIIQDFKMDKDDLFFVFQLPENSYVLSEQLDYVDYTEYDVYCIFQSLLETLKTIHDDHRIVHRDVKTDHLRIVDDHYNPESEEVEDGCAVKRVVVTNFGIGKRLPKYSDAGCKTFCGTPAYQAPEIVSGGDGNLSYKESVDMWSCGCVLFYIFGGELPFGTLEDYGYETELLYDSISKCDYNFTRNADYFDSVSDAAKDLIANLLKVDINERWDASKALQCPWMTTDKPSKS